MPQRRRHPLRLLHPHPGQPRIRRPLDLLDPNGLGMANENQLHTNTVPYRGPRRAAGTVGLVLPSLAKRFP